MDHQIEHDAHFGTTRLIRRETLRGDVPGLIDLLFKEGHHRIEVLDVSDLHDPPRGLRGREHPLRFFQRGTQRFLDQQVRPLRQQWQRHLGVAIGGNHHRNRITGRPELRQSGEPPAAVLRADLRRPRVARFEDSGQLRPGQRGVDPGVMLAERANTGDTAANLGSGTGKHRPPR